MSRDMLDQDDARAPTNVLGANSHGLQPTRGDGPARSLAPCRVVPRSESPNGAGSPLSADLDMLIRREVGVRTLASLHEHVRRSMLMEAMRKHGGNITQAARTLGLSRQAVQQMVASLDLKLWARDLRQHRPPRDGSGEHPVRPTSHVIAADLGPSAPPAAVRES